MSVMNAIVLVGLVLAGTAVGCTKTGGDGPGGDPTKNRVILTEEKTALLRNPAMGWGIYEEIGLKHLDPATYWMKQKGAAKKYASFLYVRWGWADLEPEQGVYAWEHNTKYKNLIKGARDLGLKLCFCIFHNSQDCWLQNTPQYVRDAGAEGYLTDGQQGEKYWTAYPDDPVFQQKFEAFLAAFAEEYDDPGVVDFIDGTNVGWWGECHHIELKDPTKLRSVFDWLTTAYSDAFKKVILAHPFGSEFGWPMEKSIAVEGKGYAMRRNGLASQWYNQTEQNIVESVFGKTPLFGEGCWWGGNYLYPNYMPFQEDVTYDLDTWRDVYELMCKQALEGHFNTLDLRNPTETAGWVHDATDLIEKFIAQGGYRFYPRYVDVPKEVLRGQSYTVDFSWGNKATGYCPNNLPNWNYKYKTAFALLDSAGEVAEIFISEEAEPSKWLYGQWYDYRLEVTPSVPAGSYRWALAIVDTSLDDKPGILISVKESPLANGWIPLNNVTVK